MLVDTMIDRLADDHRNVSRLAAFVGDAGLRAAGTVETSSVLTEIRATRGGVGAFVAAHARRSPLHHPPKGRRIRFVTDADVAADIEEARRSVLAAACEVAPPRPTAQ
jgi:hypothetical protein